MKQMMASSTSSMILLFCLVGILLCIAPVFAGELPFLEAKVAKQMLSSHRSSSQWSLRDLSSGDTKGYYPRQVPEIDDGWEEMFITYRDFEDTKDPTRKATGDLHHEDNMVHQTDIHMTSSMKIHKIGLLDIPIPSLLLSNKPDVMTEPWSDSFHALNCIL